MNIFDNLTTWNSSSKKFYVSGLCFLGTDEGLIEIHETFPIAK